MKLVYVAGKYSGNVETNIKHAEKVSIDLIRQGYAVITPHKNTAYYDIDYDTIIKMDLEILSRCDIIYMLKGWEESKGAKIEYDFARKEGINIFYENNN